MRYIGDVYIIFINERKYIDHFLEDNLRNPFIGIDGSYFIKLSGLYNGHKKLEI